MIIFFTSLYIYPIHSSKIGWREVKICSKLYCHKFIYLIWVFHRNVFQNWNSVSMLNKCMKQTYIISYTPQIQATDDIEANVTRGATTLACNFKFVYKLGEMIRIFTELYFFNFVRWQDDQFSQFNCQRKILGKKLFLKIGSNGIILLSL